MSNFLELSPQQQTGLQIKGWINSLNNNIDSAKTNYDNIINWLSLVEGDDSYSEDDKLAVILSLQLSVEKIKSLLPSE